MKMSLMVSSKAMMASEMDVLLKHLMDQLVSFLKPQKPVLGTIAVMIALLIHKASAEPELRSKLYHLIVYCF